MGKTDDINRFDKGGGPDGDVIAFLINGDYIPRSDARNTDLMRLKRQPESLFIPYDKLQRFASMDIVWPEITKESLLQRFDIEIEAGYEMTLDDLRSALVRCQETDITLNEFLTLWFWPLVNTLRDALCLTGFCGEDNRFLLAYRLRSVPATDDELFHWCLSYLYGCIIGEFEITRSMKLRQIADYEGLIDMIDCFRENEGIPVEEWDYPDVFMRDFIANYDNDLILSDADGTTRALFRKFTDELCLKDDFGALRMKAYALYGGNSVYECDYALAEKYLTRLWRDHGFGYAANTLGHLYLNGLLDGGKPDYEKAFMSFSVGSSFRVPDSVFNLAYMFMKGQYVMRDPSHARFLVALLYDEYRSGFTSGYYDCAFPDAAYHRGMLELQDDTDGPEFLRAYRAFRYFLQARFALGFKAGMKASGSESELKNRINRELAKMTGIVRQRKASFKASVPEQLYEFIKSHEHSVYHLRIKYLKGSRARIDVDRIPKGHDTETEKSIVTYPELSCCSLTDKISFIVEDVRFRNLVSENETNVLFDGIDMNMTEADPGTHYFSFSGERVAELHGGSFIISRP